jgi:ATP-dependent DNA ligase
MDNTVLIATLDDVLHSLRLEDVWKWCGTCVTDKPYSERRPLLKEFVEKHWIPDARLLGGIFTSIAQPMSMDAFAAKQDWSQLHSVEFIPEQAGRRRMILYLEVQQKAATGPAAEKHLRSHEPRPIPPAAPRPASRPQQQSQIREARAVPVDKMPDVYDLYDREGLPISRASVQQFSLSLKLRESGENWVKAKWVPEFGGYEIIEILPM